MRGFASRSLRHALMITALGTVSVIGHASAAYAQELTRRFDIEVQSLDAALNTFALQTGRNVLYPPDIVASKTSPGVRGQMTDAAALEALLAGTGLVFDETRTRALVLRVPSRSAPAVGERQSALAEDGPSEVREIVVTGSRIARSTYLSSNPITVIGAQQMADLGQNSVVEVMRIVPQNTPFQSNMNIGLNGPQRQGNVGVEAANLRGLNPAYGGVRTLVMVDTRRFVPTTAGGAVDLNQVPSMLIQSTEVVTGGASAQYGTDAIAGVVNILLDHDLTGFRGQVDYGQTFEDDGRNWHGSFATGAKFAGGRGHVIVGGEYSNDEGIGDCNFVRNWCADSWYAVTNELNRGSRVPEGHPALRGGPPVPPNGSPRNVIARDVKTSQYSLTGTLRGGVIGLAGVNLDNGLLAAPVDSGSGVDTSFTLVRSNPGILEYTYFNDQGAALAPYDPGLFPSVFNFAVGGDGGPYVRLGSESPLRIPSERAAFLARGQYDFANAVTGFVEVNYASRQNVYQGNSQGPASFFMLSTNNAYLQCSNYASLTNAQRATLALRQANCAPVTVSAPAGTVIQTAGSIGLYGPGELDAENRLTAARDVPITDLPSRLWNAFRTDVNQGERYLASGATAPYTDQSDFVDPTIGPLTWAKHTQLAARPLNTSASETVRFVAGLQGGLSDRWNWDAYYQYGHSGQREDLNNTRVDVFFKSAIDAVFAPDGSIQCNLLVDPNHPNNPSNPNNVNAPELNEEYAACAPLNLIGLTESNGRLTPEAVEYAYRTQQNDVEYEQQVLAGNVRGDLSEGWAGPIGVAAGFEARKEVGVVTHGSPVPAYYRYFSRPQLGFPYSGKLEIYEAYGEVNVPLIRDALFAELFEIGGAYRNTWQTNSDATLDFEASKDLEFSTWKANVDWAMSDWLRFRGTRSRDVRAAGFRDLTFKGTPTAYGTTEGRLSNPWPQCFTAGRVGSCNEDNSIVTQSGNFTLEPEEADTTSLGFVFTPGGVAEGFHLSTDWYEIEIAQAISSGGGGISAQGIVDQCFNFGNFCEFIQQDVGGNNNGPFRNVSAGQPVTDIGAVRPVSQNLGAFIQRGLDISVKYNSDLDRFVSGWRGNLNIRSIFTYVFDFIVDPNATVAGDEINYAGQSATPTDVTETFGDFVPGPNWRSSHWITYTLGGFTATLGIQHVGASVYDVSWHGPDDPLYDPTRDDSVNDNTVNGSTITSLAMSYEFHPFRRPDASSELFLAMDNIFAVDPPVAPSGVGFPTNPVYFDTQGARWRAGLRVRF